MCLCPFVWVHMHRWERGRKCFTSSTFHLCIKRGIFHMKITWAMFLYSSKQTLLVAYFLPPLQIGIVPYWYLLQFERLPLMTIHYFPLTTCLVWHFSPIEPLFRSRSWPRFWHSVLNMSYLQEQGTCNICLDKTFNSINSHTLHFTDV